MGLEVPRGSLKACYLRFDSGCSFILTPAEGGRTIASLIFRPRVWDEAIPDKLFGQAEQEWQAGRLIQPCITPQNEIVLAVSVDDEVMSVQALDDVLRRLLALKSAL